MINTYITVLLYLKGLLLIFYLGFFITVLIYIGSIVKEEEKTFDFSKKSSGSFRICIIRLVF